jgi:endonuclease YncB( thermonuclease family)
MQKKLTNICGILFLGIFFGIIFNTATSAQSQNLRVKSHLQFDKEFSGNTFVLDGDSLKVGGKEVRLFGVDAPEYKQTCFDAKKKEYACGQVSRDFLINLAGGKQVTCLYAEKDKYDRFLSKCSVDKISINEEIVKNGMAVIYNFTESDEKMDKLEAEAKEKKLGIWKGAFQLPKDYRKANPRKL